MHKYLTAVVALILLSLPAQAFAVAETTPGISFPAPYLLLFIVGVTAGIYCANKCMNRLHRTEDIVVTIQKEHTLISFGTVRVILSSVLAIVLLYTLSLHTVWGMEPFTGEAGRGVLGALFLTLGILGTVARLHWPVRSQHYVFATIIGTAVTFILIGFKRTLFTGAHQDPFLMTMGVLALYVAWRFLFGPWRPQVKATVLTVFIFWTGMHILFREAEITRSAHMLAIAVALLPALIWCFLFLGYHRQRLSVAFLMFLSGMISTAPILFYDAVVRSGAELQFFLFRIVPESFTRTSNVFVSGSMIGFSGTQSTVMATLITFLLVGLIEEVSKFWVLRRSGERIFSSIDDVLQLAIIVAIGFAFAENVLNPSYFIGFVRQYLVVPAEPQWSAFISNVAGRAILTNMVHIVSSGVLGYFYGLALFAAPSAERQVRSGMYVFLPRILYRLFRLPERESYKAETICFGLVLSIALHGFFNFLVTLPDILPGNPKTIGQILGASETSWLQHVNLLVVPSLFYVVGGFWVLTTLFYRKECMKEWGHLVRKDTFVITDVAAVA